MKLSTNTYQRLLWITVSASLLGIVGCSNLPKTASSNNTALYGSNDDRSLDRISVIGLSPTAYNALDNPHPAPAGEDLPLHLVLPHRVVRHLAALHLVVQHLVELHPVVTVVGNESQTLDWLARKNRIGEATFISSKLRRHA